MSTGHCERLCHAFRIARSRPTRAIVLAGGADFISNDIDLNSIEASIRPPRESWRNIVAIDDLAREILHANSQLVVAALGGNACSDDATLALAADVVLTS
jgi:putative two-component system hydrogenase maturation factor HypX/HoxX